MKKTRAGSTLSTRHLTLPIRASELGEYSYCARAWWYRHVVKLSPPAGEGASRLVEGHAAHANHGRRVETATRLRALGLVIALLGTLALVAALALALIG
jgi:hypothetical protein